MNKLKKKLKCEKAIAEHWSRNAAIRFTELVSGRDNTYVKTLCPVLHKLVENASNGHAVLDVGCGLGFFSDFLRSRGFDVTGIDLSPVCISVARKQFPELKLSAQDISSFAKGKHQSFDTCVVNMVLHNVPNINKFIESIYNILKPNGVLVGCIPRLETWFDRKRGVAKPISVDGRMAYLAPFKIRGSKVHPAPIIYFPRANDEYWAAFRKVGFESIEAISIETKPSLPDDLVFFVAKKLHSPSKSKEGSQN